MLRFLLLLVLLTDRTRTAFVTNPPTFVDRLDKLYEKLERFTLSPIKKTNEKLYEKLDRLNALMPDKEFTDDDDEELLSAMQTWVPNMTDEMLQDVVQELQRMKADTSEKKLDGDYGDEYIDDELDQEFSDDYANDVGEWNRMGSMDDEPTNEPILGVTPSAFTRLEGFRHAIVSAVDPIAATKERPRILDDSQATSEERRMIRKAAVAKIASVVRSAKCLTPQPRWLSVRKLAPAADTVYMPPCVQLHRCAFDSGCCYNEEEVCAPVEGNYVALPFLLNKADGKLLPARIMFYNHTRCACVSRETLETTERIPISRTVSNSVEERQDGSREKQNDWQGFSRASTEEPRLERDEEQTSPPQLVRCTCPVLFKSQLADGVCSCTCDWPEPSRRQDCQSLARGREHFGLRDRVCIEREDCNKPTCVSGSYDVNAGKCPHRFKRQSRRRSRYQQRRG